MAKEGLADIVNIMRRDVLKMTTKSGSGHPTSCMSCAEIMASLFFSEMRYEKSDNPDNDEFVLSKGHAAPILYSALFRAGVVSGDIMSLRKFGSKFEGHPTPELDWVKVATGSLGQGLGVGVGMALGARLANRKYKTYVLIGDSEMSEGSNYEAMQLAGYYKLNNLIAIVDINRLGQRGETMLGHDINDYKKRFESFGWKVIKVNGHNTKEIVKALREKTNKPKAILAKTKKGKGFSLIENKNGWHGKALSEEDLEMALKKIPEVNMPNFKIKFPKKINSKHVKKTVSFTNYRKGEEVATRKAYGNALANLVKSDNRILALDAEVSNSTYANKAEEVNKKSFVECFIAEQNMISMALGLSKKGFNVFASSFAAFLSRAHDQLRMAALSEANFSVAGSHAGVSIGQDGSSQMGLDDLALFRSLPGSVVFYPSDAVSTEKLGVLASRTKGLKYIRTTRADTPVIYKKNEKFRLGDFKVLRKGKKVVLVGSGITLHECLKAADKLKGASVIDLYCVKPFDKRKFLDFVRKSGKKIVVVEDHFQEGGIGEMIASSIASTDIKMKHLCVRKIPHSGKPEELLSAYGIDDKAIIGAVKGGWK